MKTFEIQITEYYQKIVKVEASTVEEAISKVENKYGDGLIELTVDDFKNFEIEEYKDA